MKYAAAALSFIITAALAVVVAGFTFLMTSGDGTSDYIGYIWLLSLILFALTCVIAAGACVFIANLFLKKGYSDAGAAGLGLLVSLLLGGVLLALSFGIVFVVYIVAWEMR
jgi:hypothetical protein